MSEASPSKVYDVYASILNFKKEVSTFNLPYRSESWVPDEHLRRLQAYEILSAYYWNYSRDYRFSAESGTDGDNDLISEYGSPAWLCNRIKSKLMGDKVTASVKRPRSVKNIKKLEKRLEAAEETEKVKLAEEIAALKSLADYLTEREEYLQEWFDDNDILLDIDANEVKASYLGDMVYMAQWDSVESIPTIETYDPGFVFPAESITGSLDPEYQGEVSERIVIAWEEVGEVEGTFKIWRDIWELRAGKCFRHYGYYQYSGSTDLDIEGLLEKDLISGTSKGWIDTELDFIPIVIIPNIAVEGQSFGISNLHFLISIFDSILNNDTDLKKNSEKLGGAIVSLSGKDITLAKDPTTKLPVAIEVEPNSVYTLGENGSMDLLDTSSMQKALLETGENLERILIRNSQITEVGAGLIDPQQLSGIALKVLAQPLIELVGPMRLARKRYYSKLFWMIQKLYQLKGSSEERAIFKEPLYDVVLSYGSVIAVDRKSQLEELILMLSLFDKETVLEMAQEEGFDIDVGLVLERKRTEAQENMQSQMDLFGMRQKVDEGEGEE